MTSLYCVLCMLCRYASCNLRNIPQKCGTVWSLEWMSFGYEVNARCRLENQFSHSPFKWSIFFVSCCLLHLGPFISMGQLEIPSCLILTAGILVCVVTSSLLRESGGEGLGSESNTLSSLTLVTHLSSQAHPPLYFFFTSSFSVLSWVKDKSNWCETFRNEFDHVCPLRSGKEGWLGPGHHHSTGIIRYSALIGPDKTIP